MSGEIENIKRIHNVLFAMDDSLSKPKGHKKCWILAFDKLSRTYLIKINNKKQQNKSEILNHRLLSCFCLQYVLQKQH